MFKFLINFVLLNVMYLILWRAIGEDFDTYSVGFLILSAMSLAVCALGNWLVPVSSCRVMSRDDALNQCVKGLTVWPDESFPLSVPPDGWVWVSTNLYSYPVLVSTDSIITSGDWHDGF